MKKKKEKKKVVKTKKKKAEVIERVAVDRAAQLGALNQRIQYKIWEYADTQKVKRDASLTADEIMNDCLKTFEDSFEVEI